MQDVKIIDIDNVQWNIKDQETRNKTAILEEEITRLKTVEKWDYEVPIYGGHITARRQGNVVSVTGYNIGMKSPIPQATGNIDFGILPERFRPSEQIFFMLRTSGSYSTQYGGMVFPDGKINSWTYVKIDFGYFSVSYIVD